MKNPPNILDLTFQAGRILERFWAEKDVTKRQQMTVTYYTTNPETADELKEEIEMVEEILNHYGGKYHRFGSIYFYEPDDLGRWYSMFDYTYMG